MEVVSKDLQEDNYKKLIREQLQNADWKDSLELQIATMRLLTVRAQRYGDRKVFELYDSAYQSKLLNTLATALDWVDTSGSPDSLRVLDVLGLSKQCNGRMVPDLMAMRRALSSSSRKRLNTEPGADLMPRSGWLSDYLDYAHFNEAPISFHFFSALAILGLGMRRNVVFDRDAFEYWPNTYSFLIGPTAGRKSQAMGMAKAVGKFSRRLIESAQERHYSTTVGTGTDADPVYDHRPIFLPKEVSPQKLIEMLQVRINQENGFHYTNDSVGILMNDEVATLIGKTVKFSDDMIARLTDLYSAEDTGGRATITWGEHKMRNICFSFVFGSAPSWIKTSVTANMFQGGFLNRSVFVYRQYKGDIIPHPDILDPIAMHHLASALVPWSMINGPIVFYFEQNSEPRKWFDSWYSDNHPIKLEKIHTDKRLVSYLSRKQDHLCRMAMLLQISDNMGSAGLYESLGMVPIELQYLQQADRILTFEENYLPECFSWFGEMEDGEKTQMVLDAAQKVAKTLGCNEFTRGELTKMMANVGRGKRMTLTKEWMPHLDQLIELGHIEEFFPNNTGSGKRPWIRVLLNSDGGKA